MYFLWVKPCARLNTFINYTLHNSQYTLMQMELVSHTPRVEFLFPPLLWNSCNETPLAFKARTFGALTPIAVSSGWGS